MRHGKTSALHPTLAHGYANAFSCATSRVQFSRRLPKDEDSATNMKPLRIDQNWCLTSQTPNTMMSAASSCQNISGSKAMAPPLPHSCGDKGTGSLGRGFRRERRICTSNKCAMTQGFGNNGDRVIREFLNSDENLEGGNLHGARCVI